MAAFSLQPLLDLMQTRADEATRKLSQLIAAEQNQRSRLQMLETYREEYAQRFRDAAAQGISPQTLRNYQDFMVRIDEAISQQRTVVESSVRSTKAGQDHWHSQNRQLKAIDTLSVRHEARERVRDSRQEQKILDEYSTRQYSQNGDTDSD